MKHTIAVFLIMAFLLSGCSVKEDSLSYHRIGPEEAKEMMDTQPVIILDVRELAEFEDGHIPGAVLLPVSAISKDSAAAVIPNYDTTVLVYCRSGNRSQTASRALTELGYSEVFEFGGINSWTYEVE